MNYQSIFLELSLNYFGSETKLINKIKELQKVFISREDIQDYSANLDLVWAYVAIYVPTNLVKLHHLFDRVKEDLPDSFEDFTFIDVGAGPGTYTWGLLDYLYDWKNKKDQLKKVDIKQKLVVFEKSKVMIDKAKIIQDKLKISSKIIKYCNDTSKLYQNTISPEKTLLFFGNSLNEMSVDYAFEIIKKINPSYLMFLEPGTKDSFHKIMQLRARLFTELEYFCVYPCPNKLSNCPMTEQDWCHQYVSTIHSHDIERICQLSKMDRRKMPLTFHYYTKNNRKFDSEVSKNPIQRITHFIKETKFSLDYIVCKNENDSTILEKSIELKKDLKKMGLKKKDYKKILGEKLH